MQDILHVRHNLFSKLDEMLSNKTLFILHTFTNCVQEELALKDKLGILLSDFVSLLNCNRLLLKVAIIKNDFK